MSEDAIDEIAPHSVGSLIHILRKKAPTYEELRDVLVEAADTLAFQQDKLANVREAEVHADGKMQGLMFALRALAEARGSGPLA